jgi:hypothetical protein
MTNENKSKTWRLNGMIGEIDRSQIRIRPVFANQSLNLIWFSFKHQASAKQLSGLAFAHAEEGQF